MLIKFSLGIAFLFLTLATTAQPKDDPEYNFKYSKAFEKNIVKYAKTTIDAAEIDGFHEGIAIIRKGENFALINPDGSFAIPYGQYKFNVFQGYKIDRNLCGFRNGMCIVRDPTTEKYGAINRHGDLVVPCTLNKIEPFKSDGYAWAIQIDVKGKEEQIFINKQGKKFKLKNQNLYNHNLLEAYALPTINGYNEFYDKEGNFLFRTKKRFSQGFSDGLLQVDTNFKEAGYKSGFINKKGNQVIPYQFKGHFYPFHEGLALYQPPTTDEFQYAYLTKQGKLVNQLHSQSRFNDLNFGESSDFRNHYAYGTSNGRGISIDTNGRMQFIDELILKHRDNQDFIARFKTFEVKDVKRVGEMIKFTAEVTYDGTQETVSGGLNGGRKYIETIHYDFHGDGYASMDGRIIIAPLYRYLDDYDIDVGLAKATFVTRENVETTGYAGRYSTMFMPFQMVLPNNN